MIHRREQVPFAQVALEALRDRRLSFRARGVLAMVLSHAEEWEAPRDWIVDQSERDGKDAIQSALNELTELGYRRAVRVQDPTTGRWRHEAHWFHVPRDAQNAHRPPDSPTAGQTDRRANRPAGKPAVSVDHPEEELPIGSSYAQVRNAHPRDSDFDSDFWAHAIKKRDRGRAEQAYRKAITRTLDPEQLLAAWRQANLAWACWPETAHRFIPLPSTWLNAGRWADEPVNPHEHDPPGQADGKVTGMLRRLASNPHPNDHHAQIGGIT